MYIVCMYTYVLVRERWLLLLLPLCSLRTFVWPAGSREELGSSHDLLASSPTPIPPRPEGSRRQQRRLCQHGWPNHLLCKRCVSSCYRNPPTASFIPCRAMTDQSATAWRLSSLSHHPAGLHRGRKFQITKHTSRLSPLTFAESQKKKKNKLHPLSSLSRSTCSSRPRPVSKLLLLFRFGSFIFLYVLTPRIEKEIAVKRDEIFAKVYPKTFLLGMCRTATTCSDNSPTSILPSIQLSVASCCSALLVSLRLLALPTRLSSVRQRSLRLLPSSSLPAAVSRSTRATRQPQVSCSTCIPHCAAVRHR